MTTAIRTRTHYHLAVTTQSRDHAFVARTKAVATRWAKYFRKHFRESTVDVGSCAGESCISQAWEILS